MLQFLSVSEDMRLSSLATLRLGAFLAGWLLLQASHGGGTLSGPELGPSDQSLSPSWEGYHKENQL